MFDENNLRGQEVPVVVHHALQRHPARVGVHVGEHVRGPGHGRARTHKRTRRLFFMRRKVSSKNRVGLVELHILYNAGA